MPSDLDERKVQVIREAHGETGAVIIAVYEALPPVMAHRWLEYDYWTQVGHIERLRTALKDGGPSLRRPVGHVTDLIRRLSTWRDRRQSITDRPKRSGKPLPNTELDEAIEHLEEYRELLASWITLEATSRLHPDDEKPEHDLGWPDGQCPTCGHTDDHTVDQCNRNLAERKE